MATWQELKSFVQTTYPTSDDQGNMVRIIFGLDGGRSQLVLLWRHEIGGDEWVEIESPIGELDAVDVRRALGHVEQYICGGLSLTEGHVMLKHSAPIANLDTNELQEPLEILVLQADKLEQQLTGSDQY